MRCFAIADVAGPSGLVVIGGWILLFFIVGVLIIIASVFIIRAELKKIKKMNEAAVLTEKESAETARTESGSTENADANGAKE